jgi:hypothetical protein
MATGDGPRDWEQSESYTFPYAPGGVHATSRSTEGHRPATSRRSSRQGWLSLLLGLVALGIAVVDFRGQVLVASTVGLSGLVYGVLVLRRRQPWSFGIRIAPMVGVVLGTVGVIIMVGSFTSQQIAANSADLVHPPAAVLPPAGVSPTPVKYATAEAERSAVMNSLPVIAGSLVQIANRGQPMPTSFTATEAGTLLAEPSGQVLGPLPYGITLEWVQDPTGRVTQLTLIGPSFGSRVPLDVGAIVGSAPASTTT